ncbi:MAG: DUF1266 domain-containing protein [Lacrimispora sp.]|uniref:DUF1266 domain-containing protein n=1 Tax=Lacrimispora sp. TaxID=2719234 RepID=UPI0039E46483
MSKKIKMTDTMLWLNGTYAGIIMENGGDIFSYGARKMPFQLFNRKLERTSLKVWWGIRGTAELLEQIEDKSGEGGLHCFFDEVMSRKELMELPKEKFDEEIQRELHEEDSEYQENIIQKMQIIREMSQEKKRPTIIAYDYCRAIMLCIRGYACGYIPFERSIGMAIVIAKKLQKHFRSWDEMNESYLTGYEYWLRQYKEVDQSLEDRIKATDEVRDLENSPFNLPWDMELCHPGVNPDDYVLFSGSRTVQKKTVQKKTEGMVHITLHLNARLQPIDRGDVYEYDLDKTLKKYRMGEIVGGGTALGKDGEVEDCDIEISLKEDLIEDFIGFVNSIPIPKGSYLMIDEDTLSEKDRFQRDKINVGQLEGLALYLNGSDLPKEVYESCDVNYVMEELEKILSDCGEMFSYFEGSTETALYFYGESFDKMKNRISSFIEDYPLCRQCRIIQIA